MNLGQSFLIALGMLKLHKMRAFLTMLGVIIGVMSVTIIVMISGAFQSYLEAQFAKIGSDTIFIAFEPSRLERGQIQGDLDRLRLTDIDYLKERTGSIEIASGYREAGRHTVKFGESEVKNVGVRAVDQNFIELNRIELKEGRYISEQDQTQRANVCVLSSDAAKAIFGQEAPVGKYVTMGGITLQVVGVSEPLELMGDRDTKTLFMPLATANAKWLGGDRIDLILVRPKKSVKVDDALEEIHQALMAKSKNRSLYMVESSQNVLKVFQSVIGVAGAALAAVAALSLLVGGIGIMNIMLVSVTERTKEIGLRKAVGAKRGAILGQFLVEAATLSLVGGLIGMGIAWTLGNLVTLWTIQAQWPNKDGLATPFPLPAAIMAATFSAMIGMVFGFYPAVSASRLDPIVALRRE
ncbi:MAG TPA: ABC transporter permease [Fimbriimonadaceae bacterium]|mgnify:CR=1 FL=1|nr:ABC transporter permease [Fimbriimonadaceae bacterium]HRJ95313.1 ABC transporter permease [Fimbriimonadaceae bacterium]